MVKESPTERTPTVNHWLDSNRRRIAQDTFARLGWDEDPLFVPIPKDVSRLVRSYWIYVYLSGLIRYHL
mgnify:CR=1 FL=1|jgi:hypothetical protein